MTAETTRAHLQRLGSSVAPVRDREDRERQREQIVGAINRQAARLQERGRSWRSWYVGLTAAALVAAVVVVVGTMMVAGSDTRHLAAAPNVEAPMVGVAARITAIEGSGRVRFNGVEAAAADRMAVEWGARVLVAAQSHLRLTMPNHSEVVLSERTELGLPPRHDASLIRLTLDRGRGEFSVAPLPEGHRFVVSTPDTEVVVHGTRFVVQVQHEDGEVVTTVEVLEGEVGVNGAGREVVLVAGQDYSSRAPATAPATPELLPEGADPQPSASVRSSATVAHQEEAPGSTLAAETREYMLAMAAKRRGDDEQALARVDDFLRRHPHSTLAPHARVERFRLLKALGHERDAADEARRYLAEHPDGFARGEARGMAIPEASAEPPRR
jgi:hypothetical protein